MTTTAIEKVTKPTDQSTNPRQQSHQTHANKVTKPTTTIIDQTREWKRDFTIINRPRWRLRLASFIVAETMAKTKAETRMEAEIKLHSL